MKPRRFVISYIFILFEKRRAAETRTRSLIDEANRKHKNGNKENAFHPYKKDGRTSP